MVRYQRVFVWLRKIEDFFEKKVIHLGAINTAKIRLALRQTITMR